MTLILNHPEIQGINVGIQNLRSQKGTLENVYKNFSIIAKKNLKTFLETLFGA